MTPKGNPAPTVINSPLLLPRETPDLLSLSALLPFSDNLYQWNLTIGAVLCLFASFCFVFEIQFLLFKREIQDRDQRLKKRKKPF